MEKNSKIFVAGHRGLVGSAIVRTLEERGYTNIVTRTRQELDLLNQSCVEEFFKSESDFCARNIVRTFNGKISLKITVLSSLFIAFYA